MSERGTEISAFDFAKYNEILLGNESIIIADRKKIFNKFEKFLIDALSNIKLIKKNILKSFQEGKDLHFQNLLKILIYSFMMIRQKLI